MPGESGRGCQLALAIAVGRAREAVQLRGLRPAAIGAEAPVNSNGYPSGISERASISSDSC